MIQSPLGSIHLLTHGKELYHPTNTAQLALPIAARYNVPLQQHLWHRTAADLFSTLFVGSFVLLYPSPQARQFDADLHSTTPLLPWTNTTRFLVIDATWQQAQKMMNQSPYLQQLEKAQLNPLHASSFVRRRNQRDGAWCTAEVIQWLWQSQGYADAAAALAADFRRFNSRESV